MNKFYTLALCGAVCLSAAAGGQRFKSVRNQKGVKKIHTESAAPIWRPVSQTDYMHDGDDWMKMGDVSFKYDNRGNCTEELVDEEGMLSKKVTTYDEFNQKLTELETESMDGTTWENNEKSIYVYDTKVHDFFTERQGYDWSDGTWVMNYEWEGNSITRNDDSNIIELVKSLPLMNELKPALKSVWNYGTDGKANEYFYYTTEDGSTWSLYDNLSYKDIVWEKTDGQMTIFGDLVEMTTGENLLKSAVVYYNDQPDGHYLVEYPQNGEYGFFIKETTNNINEVGRTSRMEVIDANGSLRYTETEYFDEEGNIFPDPVYINVQEAIMDEHGNMVLYTDKETDEEGIEEIVEALRYNYTYNADGNPTEVITENYDYDSESYYPAERTVFGDYIDVTSGVETVTAGDNASWSMEGDTVTATAPGITGLTVYNLQGSALVKVGASDSTATVSLSSLAPGVYIVRADGTGSTIRVAKR